MLMLMFAYGFAIVRPPLPRGHRYSHEEQMHLAPPFDKFPTRNLVIDRMQEVGLYLMYDMRYTYMNSTPVTEQVNAIKTRPNLLLWYAGDTASQTPLNATTIGLDGYHPVSLVLDCEDYYWSSHTAGMDVVM